ncbi:MAG: copper homeostasis protein CutC [Gemmatimonadota bacterium]|nr:copper homeostasis protein CutC [Gemmatimonadota bacterium]
MNILVEACVDSVHTAVNAVAAGAGRIELCGTGDGGTTPSFGMMTRCRALVKVPMHVMIRPRSGNFVYDDNEFAVMMHDIALAQRVGAHGVVFGVLHDDFTIDETRMRLLCDAARPMRVACHRAFDLTPDATEALETLLRLRVDIVLTSGHAPIAVAGAAQLAEHVRAAGNELSIMAGGGIRAQNVLQTVSASGVHEIHVRATDTRVFADVVTRLALHATEKPQ